MDQRRGAIRGSAGTIGAGLFGQLAGDELGLLHDLFLEAILFAADPRTALERVWPILLQVEGRLLRRLLARFRHIATVPHPGAVDAIKSIAENLSTEVAATHRLPYWPLWLPLLAALSKHADEALALAGDEVSRMTDLWLRWTPGDWPLREQAAALAVARGRQVLLAKGAGQCGADEAEGRAWRAVLAAVGERREDVVEITAALAPDDPVEEEPVAGSGGASPPQRARVDRVFFETCLDNDAIHPVIAADPELAGEILFAILAPRIPRGGFGLPGDELGINRLPGWFIPLYTRGPFLAFLRAAPAEAKRLVLRVVDAAAERWVQTRSVPIPEFEVLLADGCSRRLRGDEQVMQWYRGGSSVPSPLASALMALEKWLYDEADAGTDLAPIVGELFANTTSVAIVGLLIALACRDPRLLADPLRPLRPLLSIPELCVWDSRSKLRQPQHLLIGLFREPAEFQRLAEEWFTLDHRRVTLEQRTQQMMLTDPAVAGYLQDQLPMWRARLDPDGEPATLRFLIARLDPSNWKQRTNDRGERYWECEPPEELRAESESTAAELAERRFWMVFPGQCRQILDGELELSEGQLEEFGRRSPAGSQIHRPRTSSPTA